VPTASEMNPNRKATRRRKVKCIRNHKKKGKHDHKKYKERGGNSALNDDRVRMGRAGGSEKGRGKQPTENQEQKRTLHEWQRSEGQRRRPTSKTRKEQQTKTNAQRGTPQTNPGCHRNLPVRAHRKNVPLAGRLSDHSALWPCPVWEPPPSFLSLSLSLSLSLARARP